MKQSLQLKIGQSLTMTPQLQQAIRLLQLSTLDLQQEIQEALDSNPMLEVGEEGHEVAVAEEMESRVELETARSNDNDFEGESEPTIDEQWNESIPTELPVDTQWDDLYQNSGPISSGSHSSDDDYDFESRNSVSETLQDHLSWQLNLTPMSDRDRLIATAIIDAVDTRGRLTCDIEEIHLGLQSLLEELEEDEVMAVLHRLQQFDPAGVCCRDLRECLLVQLKQLPKDTPFLSQAKQICEHHLDAVASRDFKLLMRRTKLKEEELAQTYRLIQSLQPYPGDQVTSEETEYVVPDVFVRKLNDRWVVELNPEIAPRLRVNADYASLVRRADNSRDNQYLRDHLQEARWFIKSLLSRNETLLKVASCIVEHQRDFFEYGDEGMKPLVLHDIAEAVEMHESTISRVTTQKYMHTSRGIFELKYFFSSHVSTADGGECSSTAIRAQIRKLVSAEDPKKPLSDSKIADVLAEQGINVARRTIAKYRESMNIPPSNERKRLV